MNEQLPRMSKKYISNMMVFKDYLGRQIDKKQIVQDIDIVQDGDPILNDQGIKDMKKKVNIKMNYDGYIDRIYGKEKRQRDRLITYIGDQPTRQKKYYNQQERVIEQYFQQVKEEQTNDNKLLNQLDKDFKKNSNHDLKWAEIQRGQQIKKNVHNLIKTIVYNNNNPIVEDSVPSHNLTPRKQDDFLSFIPKQKQEHHIKSLHSRVSLVQEDEINRFSKTFYGVLKTFQGKKQSCDVKIQQIGRRKPSQVNHFGDLSDIEKYQKSILKAKQILSERDTRETIYQQHIDHEIEYLKIPKKDNYTEDEIAIQKPYRTMKVILPKKNKQQGQFGSSELLTTRSLNSPHLYKGLNTPSILNSPQLYKASKEYIPSSYQKKALQINKTEHSKEESTIIKFQNRISNLNDNCQDAQNSCEKIISKGTKSFQLQFNKLQTNYDEAFQ